MIINIENKIEKKLKAKRRRIEIKKLRRTYAQITLTYSLVSSFVFIFSYFTHRYKHKLLRKKKRTTKN